MKRKDMLVAAAGAAGSAALLSTVMKSRAASTTQSYVASVPNHGKPLTPPKQGLPRVAIVLGPDTVAIDAVGPMEAFSNTYGPGFVPRFMIYTVAASMRMVAVENFWVVPDYTFENVLQPHVIVIPQQRILPETVAWVKEASASADVTMSVCTGAFLLAKTGLLDGLAATTHHAAYDRFEKTFPKVKLLRGPRYVENENVSSAGGESSGIDLALRVVERYYGKEPAAETAYQLEHVRRARPMSVNDV